MYCESESTIPLWENQNRKHITLKNIQTGKSYAFVIRTSFVVGRAKELCNMQITTEDRYISGKHLRFINEEQGVFVEDLRSKNGTKLNGKAVVAKTRIHKGDILQMGRSRFEVIL